MKIMHVTTRLDPAAGGPPVVALRLAGAQASLGHDVEVVSYRPGPDDRSLIEEAARLPGGDRLRVETIDVRSGLDRRLGRSARRWFAAQAQGVEFLHLHEVWSTLLLAAAGAAHRSSTPYAIAPHGVLDPWSMSQKRLKKAVAWRAVFKRMVCGAAFVHVMNEDERRLIQPLGIRCPLEVIANGIFLEEIADLQPEGSFTRSRPELDGAPYVLFLSRMHHKKGLDFLAGAFSLIAAEFPEHHLVVAGPDGGARADFEQRIEAEGLSPRTHVVGPLYGRDKFAALSDAACFCLPSRQEGFPMAVIEAIACGVPAVVTRACHFPEVASSGAGAEVDCSADSVADGLRSVLSDPEARHRMGQSGRRLVRERYTWPKIAEHTLDLYERYSRRGA